MSRVLVSSNINYVSFCKYVKLQKEDILRVTNVFGLSF